MQWNLEVGQHLKTLELVEKQTGKTPQMLLDQPELHHLLQAEWEAFAVLDKGRQSGWNGPQPIILSEIESYCRLNEVEDRHQLVKYIHLMDTEYLEWCAEKRKQKEGKKGG